MFLVWAPEMLGAGEVVSVGEEKGEKGGEFGGEWGTRLLGPAPGQKLRDMNRKKEQ